MSRQSPPLLWLSVLFADLSLSLVFLTPPFSLSSLLRFFPLCTINAKGKEGGLVIVKEWGQCICHGGNRNTIQYHSWVNLFTWWGKKKKKTLSDWGVNYLSPESPSVPLTNIKNLPYVTDSNQSSKLGPGSVLLILKVLICLPWGRRKEGW